MRTKEILEEAKERLRGSASVKRVYGEPVTADGKIIIPVAKVAYHEVEGTAPEAGSEEAAQAGAETASVAAKPLGVVEISEGKTRFVRYGQTRKLALAALLGLGVGAGLGTLVARLRKND